MEDNNKYIKSHTIFCFWHSDDLNTISHLRKVSLECLKSVSKCNVELITPSRLKDFIVEGHPLHPAFEHLSAVHKSDYLRVYFMRFHGGGYCDIKVPCGDWITSFEDMLDNPDMVANGYRENCEYHIAYTPNAKFFNELIGNGCYIMRSNTDFTKRWLDEVHTLLDSKLELLKTNPAKHNYDKAEEGTGYPIEWNEMLGRIFHKISIDYSKNFLYTVPRLVLVHYK